MWGVWPVLRDFVFPLMVEAAMMIKGVPKKVEEMKNALKKLQHFIHEEDKNDAATEEDKKKVKQLIEAAFRMEDIIDEYLIIGEQESRDPGCAALPDDAADFLKTMSLRLQIAYKIQYIKSQLPEIEEKSKSDGGSKIQSSLEQGPSNSGGNQNVTLQNLREAPLYMEESDFVGFETPTAELIDWLENGKAERTVIFVVGMGGQGKTTLVKKVFDNKKMIGKFDHRAWITVSQDYTIEGVLKDMLVKFYKQKEADPPQSIFAMDRRSLIEEVRNYLQKGRYVVVFDDVWNVNFWDEIEFAVVDKKNKSRIIITTRRTDVSMSCKKSSFVQVHKLQPLTEKESLDLFYKKAFFSNNGCCPENLRTISAEIVKKCKGLPLAIVAIGGVLAGRESEDVSEWERFSENLSIELEKNSRLDDIRKILEGFVKEEKGMESLEKVAEGYLKELILRSLVQVSSSSIDGKVRSCQVHDLIREMILRKFEDLSFGQFIGDDDKSNLSGISRHLSIATTSKDLTGTIESSQVRSLHFFNEVELPEFLIRRIPIKYMLKVLDFEGAKFNYVPENLGNLIHLKYLSFRNTWLQDLPKSIGKLQNLETLDLRATHVHEIPKEISKLRKLQHLLGDFMSLIQLKDSIGGMASLQTLHKVKIGEYDDVEIIIELEKLVKLRELRLTLHSSDRKHAVFLCSSINKMLHLVKLHVEFTCVIEAPTLHFISSQLKLQKLCLDGELYKLPKWIPKLQNLVKLTLINSNLTKDPLKSLNMPNLLFLAIQESAYEGGSLHFQNGRFQKLKELELALLDNLNSIVIDKGALHSLKKLQLMGITQLKTVPTGFQHLKKLEVLDIVIMPTEFVQSIDPDGGQEHRIIEHVPLVTIR
ncbi:Virus X resistance protein-like, coiled-coil domain [Sesbania bispinosa]|nr:Virus X resistance protein-like, coiled-coil domain [Sesbania bispinosa]